MLPKLSVISRAAADHVSSPHNLKSENQRGPCTWSSVIEEAYTFASVSKKTDSCPLGSKTLEAREVHRGISLFNFAFPYMLRVFFFNTI